MPDSNNRRHFLGASLAAVVGTTLTSPSAAQAANAASKTVVLGVMGLKRGRDVAKQFAKVANVQVKYVCDVDTERTAQAKSLIGKMDGQNPSAITDFRRILDDQEVDALVCAAPNHWHALATTLGCSAGKHVYVEKPCSHTPAEGEMMIASARKHDRLVQMGTQRRSSPTIIGAMQKLHAGVIGRVYASQCSYSGLRKSIGHGKQTAVPANIDYELWQGPAPRRPYLDNVVHYNWHWRWHWGNGELGNNGVHALDIARWGMQVDYPTRVVSSGNRYRFDDDQETPDTQVVAFEFGDSGQITWQGRSCNKHRFPFVTFFGEQGTLEMGGMGEYKVFDNNEKEIESVEAPRLWGRIDHVKNYIDAIRSGDASGLNQEIESGHKSTMLSHLGNIAHRTGRTLQCDPNDGHLQNDEAAVEAYWSCEYEDGWEPRV
jgi:predicted dehydrogenase